MTDKERLENMSPIGFDLNGDVLLKSEDYHWLMERVEELEMKLSINTNNMKQLQKENERYKQALEEIRSLYPLRNVGYQVSEIRKIVIRALEDNDDE